MPPPPSKLRKFQHAPPISPSAKASLAMAAPESTLPKQFSWRNASDVASVLPKGATFSLTVPIHQEDCGNCWACSIITALTDRVQIEAARKKPGFDASVARPFSVAWMTACNAVCSDGTCVSGCEGSDIGTALNLLSMDFYGGVTYAECQPLPVGKFAESLTRYRDGFSGGLGGCETTAKVAGAECQELLQKCSACARPGTDGPSNVFVRAGSMQKIKDALTIKQEIYANGPVPAGYKVYADFEAEGGFGNHDGLYIHDGPESPDGTGFHAVVIVGWGEKTINYKGAITNVPFWEVRNSWGTKWGDGGFWKHAMRNDQLLINRECGVEGYQEDTYTGGVVAFAPEVRPAKAVAAPAAPQPGKALQAGLTPQGPTLGFSTVFWTVVAVIAALFCAALFCAALYWGSGARRGSV